MVPALFLSYARMTALRKSLHILVLLCVTSPAWGETLMDGLRAYDGGLYAEAVAVWGRLAKAAERLRQIDPKLTKAERAKVTRLTAEWRVLHPR